MTENEFLFTTENSGFNRISHQLIRGLAILLVVITTACSGADDDTWVPEHILEMENVRIYDHADIEAADTLTLVREQVFMDTDENPISSFGAVLSDSFGRVLIGDRSQFAIHVFDRDGDYIGRFGREGSGPGEFRWVGGMDLHNNRLYIHDVNGRRINIFNLGSDAYALPVFESAVMIGSDNWENFPEPGFVNPGFHSVRSDGSILLASRTSPVLYREYPDSIGVNRYYFWNSNSNQQPEAIFEISEPKHIVTDWFIIPPPFATRGLMAKSGNDRIFSANTRDFLIKTYEADGGYKSAFYYPLQKRELTRSDAVKSVEQHGEELQDAVRSMPIPDTWPALRQIFADNSGRLWVLVYPENDGINEWYVMEESGKLLARFELPDATSIARVNNEFLYTRETDEETGLQQVVRYRIEIGDKDD